MADTPTTPTPAGATAHRQTLAGLLAAAAEECKDPLVRTWLGRLAAGDACTAQSPSRPTDDPAAAAAADDDGPARATRNDGVLPGGSR